MIIKCRAAVRERYISTLYYSILILLFNIVNTTFYICFGRPTMQPSQPLPPPPPPQVTAAILAQNNVEATRRHTTAPTSNNNNNRSNSHKHGYHPERGVSNGRGGRGRGGGGGRNPSVSSRNVTTPNPNYVVTKVAPTTGVPFGHVPAYLPGSSSLVEELDQRIMIVLRDGRHLVGTFRSFDQYSNMVLENTSERRFCNRRNRKGNDHESDHNNSKAITYFTEIQLGLYIVRGDSIVLLGQVGQEIDDDNNYNDHNYSIKRIDPVEFEAIVAADKNDDDAADKGAQKDDPLTSSPSSLDWDFDRDLAA